jgi:hypothetical protein
MELSIVMELTLTIDRSKTSELNTRSAFDGTAIAKDCLIYPTPIKNHQNNPVWNVSEAQGLLRIDVLAKRHLTMKPQELHNTRDLSTFRGHICQEERHQKYMADKYTHAPSKCLTETSHSRELRHQKQHRLKILTIHAMAVHLWPITNTAYDRTIKDRLYRMQ